MARYVPATSGRCRAPCPGCCWPSRWPAGCWPARRRSRAPGTPPHRRRPALSRDRRATTRRWQGWTRPRCRARCTASPPATCTPVGRRAAAASTRPAATRRWQGWTGRRCRAGCTARSAARRRPGNRARPATTCGRRRRRGRRDAGRRRRRRGQAGDARAQPRRRRGRRRRRRRPRGQVRRAEGDIRAVAVAPGRADVGPVPTRPVVGRAAGHGAVPARVDGRGHGDLELERLGRGEQAVVDVDAALDPQLHRRLERADVVARELALEGEHAQPAAGPALTAGQRALGAPPVAVVVRGPGQRPPAADVRTPREGPPVGAPLDVGGHVGHLLVAGRTRPTVCELR